MSDQLKSRYLASLLRLISCGLVFCLALILPSKVQASDDESAWRISNTSGLVRYISHGTTVHGHKFGFLKQSGRCQSDILWLSWSSTVPQVEQLVGSEVTFLIDVDGTAFEIGVDMRFISALTPMNTMFVALFTNFIAGSKFIDLLSHGTSIKIKIVGPPEASKLFDIPSDNFSLIGFAKARQQAEAICEGRFALEALTQGFG